MDFALCNTDDFSLTPLEVAYGYSVWLHLEMASLDFLGKSTGCPDSAVI